MAGSGSLGRSATTGFAAGSDGAARLAGGLWLVGPRCTSSPPSAKTAPTPTTSQPRFEATGVGAAFTTFDAGESLGASALGAGTRLSSGSEIGKSGGSESEAGRDTSTARSDALEIDVGSSVATGRVASDGAGCTRSAKFSFAGAAAGGGREGRLGPEPASGERRPLRVDGRAGGREVRPGDGGVEARPGEGGVEARAGKGALDKRTGGGTEIRFGGRETLAPPARIGALRTPSTTIGPPHFLHLILVSLPAKRVANRLSGIRKSPPQATHEIVNVISRQPAYTRTAAFGSDPRKFGAPRE